MWHSCSVLTQGLARTWHMHALPVFRVTGWKCVCVCKFLNVNLLVADGANFWFWNHFPPTHGVRLSRCSPSWTRCRGRTPWERAGSPDSCFHSGPPTLDSMWQRSQKPPPGGAAAPPHTLPSWSTRCRTPAALSGTLEGVKEKKSSSQQSNQVSVLATSQAHSDQPLRGSQMLAEPRVSYLTAPSGSSGQCGQCFPAFGWTCPGIHPWRWTRPAVLVACTLPQRVSRTRPLWSAEPSPDACWGPETTNPWLSQKKSTPRCPRPSRPASILPWQSGKHWGGGWRRGPGGQQPASGTCPELSSSSPQSPLKNGPPRPSSQTSPAVAADEEKEGRKKDDWKQENRARPDHVTYRNEMGRLAVLQLDPQPVKVLVAPPHAVLRQVKLRPRRLQEINERIYGPKDKKTGKYSLNIYSLN